jgi:alpha-methylacyl-CoA racemase
MTAGAETRRGPLSGVRIIEMAGIGPGPFAGMMLADHGAEVIRVDRPGAPPKLKDPLTRSRRSIVVDLKQPAGVEVVRALARGADGLIEGLRPGVMERLGLGPDLLLADNPRLVYGRITGWGQEGPLAQAAGHDLNYIALSGSLHPMGRADEKPPVPLNLVGDFGGGGMLLAFGMVSAILAARTTGRGQVIDAAMVDGAALLAAMFYATGAAQLQGPRGSNMLGGAAPFYDTYETADGGFIAVGSIEPQFYALLLEKTGLAADPDFGGQMDRNAWPSAKAKLTALFKTRTRAEWCALMEGTDICFAPVLSMQEAPRHPHNAARETFVEAFGVLQPAPAPRYSATPVGTPTLQDKGADTDALLREAGFDADRVEALRKAGAVDGPRAAVTA